MFRIRQQRMAAIAAIGLLILTPCAAILQKLSASGEFGIAFSSVQALELLGGAVNITLMSLNLRAGLRLTGRIKRRKQKDHDVLTESAH